MPIQFSQEDTRLSFAYAVNAAQDAFTINRDKEQKRTDNVFKDTSKVVARIPANLVLGTLAAIETVVKAVLTGLSATLYYFTDRPYNYMKDSLSLAGRATVEAFKGIAGYATPAPAPAPVAVETPKEPVVVETPKEPVVETPKEAPALTRTQKARILASLAWDYKYWIAGAAVATYVVGVPLFNANVEALKVGAPALYNGVKDNAANLFVNAPLAAFDFAVSLVSSNSTNSTFTGNATNSTVNATVQAVVNATTETVVNATTAVVNAANTTA